MTNAPFHDRNAYLLLALLVLTYAVSQLTPAQVGCLALLLEIARTVLTARTKP